MFERLKALGSALGPLLTSAGPLIAFYLANHFFGLRAAVGATLVVSLLEIVYKRLRKQSLSTFFFFCAGVTVLFGTIDLTLTSPVFFRYEAAVTNLITALYFGATLWAAAPVVQELAGPRGQVPRPTDDPRTDAQFAEDRRYFFQVLTFIWTFYFLAKAAGYALLASQYSIERAMAIRAAVGTTSLYVMIALSTFGGRPLGLLLRRLRLLPSTRSRTPRP